MLVKSSFKDNYKYYESRGDKEKRSSVRQYLNKITSHSKDTGETRTVYVWSNNEIIMRGRNTDDIIRELFRYFLYN